MAGLSTSSYGEGNMNANDQRVDHQGLIDRGNAAADRAQLAMDHADRTAADGGTTDLGELRAAVQDLMAAVHGFEALLNAGVTPEGETAGGGRAAGSADSKDDKAAASKSSGTASSPGTPGAKG